MTKPFIPSPQQQALFDRVSDPRGGSVIVVAGPGSGKTTSLVKAMALMSGSVYAGAYNAKMAKELKERTSDLQNVKAGTFHAAGMNVLRRAINIKGDPDPKKILKLIDQYIVANDRKDLQEVAACVAATVSMAKQRGIGALPEFRDTDATWLEMIEHFGLDEDLPETYEDRKDIVVKFSRVMLRKSNEAAKEFGSIDFDDMIYLPLLWNLRMWQNDWVLVDEAQDTNPTRRALARRMLKPNGRLIAVGDPRQAIYGFSGADNDALDQIARDFDAKEMPLTVTYRCPKAVVKVCKGFYDEIEAHESAPEGMFTEQPFEAICDQLQPGDAVLCRYNKYLVNLCFKLIRQGKPARIEGRAIGAGLVALINKWKATDLDKIAARVMGWQDREVAKAEAKQQDAKADQIRDRAETVLVLIERAQEQEITTKAGLVKMITDLFDDRVVDNKNMITLCSVHRSKGLEFPRVFVLGLYELMGRECSQPWQSVQEVNLQWVAASRAQELLVNVTGVKEEKKQHQFGEEA
jgi:superfamily I DNA/RNA helicase